MAVGTLGTYSKVNTYDAGGVFALMALLADQKGCTQRLQEIMAAQDLADSKIKDANAAIVAAEKATAAMEAEKAEIEKFIKQKQFETDNHKSALDQLVAAQNSYGVREAAMVDREAKLKGEEHRLKQIADDLVSRETALAAAEKALAADKEAHADRVRKIAAAVGESS